MNLYPLNVGIIAGPGQISQMVWLDAFNGGGWSLEMMNNWLKMCWFILLTETWSRAAQSRKRHPWLETALGRNWKHTPLALLGSSLGINQCAGCDPDRDHQSSRARLRPPWICTSPYNPFGNTVSLDLHAFFSAYKQNAPKFSDLEQCTFIISQILWVRTSWEWLRWEVPAQGNDPKCWLGL